MKRARLLAGVSVGALLIDVGVCAAQMKGSIFGPGTRSYPVAVASLKNLSGPAAEDVGTRFADIVGRDLTLSGYFKILDRSAYIEKSESSGYTVDSINFDNWSVLGALALVKGGYTVQGDNLTLEVRLFDVYQRRQLTGRRYHGSVSELRRMANKFADEIIAQFTGERGPFDSRFAFVSTRDGKFKEIYVMSPDEGDLQQITKNQTINVSPSWSPDSRSLLYTSYKRRNPDVFLIDLISGRETLLSQRPGLNLGAKMSPDGTKVAVTVEDDGNADIILLDRSGKVMRRLTDSWAIDVSPSWSPDGKQIAFCSNRTGSPQIYVMSADGGAARRVTFSGDYNTSPAWSPKGDLIAYVSRSEGEFNVHTVKVDGGEPRQLTQGARNNEDPSWAPDGRYLVFSSSRSGHSKLFITDVTGSSQVQLTHGGGDDSSPAWSRWLE
ncbi:MAG TPA: Tol-Pal system beta propeller repeat protein TolB [Candidatus Margulisiibacteriota bacterium]|nr:Tol-Pal system beta propeller repeat protein TolB [Candidatus Margulisiibacteriota bacterium]